MKKIILIGPGGSGKSTLAKIIGKYRNLPVIHLDALYWKEGWVKTADEDWSLIVQDLLSKDSWVMDGNFGGTLDLRLAAADTVIFFDLSPVVCIWRVIKRRMKFHNKSRPDMNEGCVEQIDFEFLNWILTYRVTRRPGIMKKLNAVKADKNIVVFKSLASVKKFELELYEAQR